MSDPSTISGVLGLVLVFCVVAIAGLAVEWISERGER